MWIAPQSLVKGQKHQIVVSFVEFDVRRWCVPEEDCLASICIGSTVLHPLQYIHRSKDLSISAS